MTPSLLDDQTDLTQADPDKDYLSDLVGDGKKFSDTKALARGKYEADMYVETLKRQLDNMREDYLKVREENMTRAKLEELLDRAAAPKQNQNDSTPVVKDEPKPFDPKMIEDLVSSKLSERETQKLQEQNFNTSMAKIKERYGENYRGILTKQIEELGLDINFVNDLARKHPTVLLKTLGLDANRQSDDFGAPRSNTRNDNFSPSVKKRNWAFYEKMRIENPKLYTDPKTNVQIHNDAIAQGEAFYDN